MKLPLQREVKEAFRRLFQHGDQKVFAAARRDDPSDISREYNADKRDVENRMFMALLDVAAAYETREELGMEFQALFNRFCDELRGHKNGTAGDIDSLKQKAHRSIFEVLGDEIDKLPLTKRLKAVETAMIDLKIYEDGLRHLDMDSENAVEASTGRDS